MATIETGIEVSEAQREVIERLDLAVTREFGHIVVVDQLVGKTFGAASGRLHGEDLDKLIEEIAEKHGLAERHGLPAPTAAAKPVKPAPAAKPAKVAAKGKPAVKPAAVKPAKQAPRKVKAAAKPAAKAGKPPAAKPKPAAAAAASAWDDFPDKAKLVVIAKECPRKPGTAGAENWRLYRTGLTIAEYRAAGGLRAKLQTDLAKGRVALRK